MSAAACPYVVPFLRKDASVLDDRAYFLIGALFALHRKHIAGVSLGEAFARLYSAQGESPSLQARFMALLDAHPEDIGEHLRTAVSLLASKDIPLAWDQLLRDILLFHHPDRVVQRRWARHFWASNGPSQPQTNEVAK